MSRLMLTCAMLVAAPTLAETPDRYVYMQGDEYQLTRESDSLAVLEYLNSPANMSPGYPITLYHDGLEITVTTEVNPTGAGGAERITVQAPEGWVVDPPQLDVRDGEHGIVLLHRGEFLGM